MTDKRKFNAHINRKGLDATGITEDHVRAMASRLGQSTMLIVEAKHLQVTTDAEGTVVLALALQNVEPVPPQHDETVRRFQRGLYLQRPEQQGQAALTGTGDEAQTEVDTGAAGMKAAVETDDDGTVRGIWDGSTDGPLTPPAAPEGGYCSFPGCDLEDNHDGDHATAGDDDEPAEPEE